MPLIGKKKDKGGGDAKASAKKQKQDRFMRRALNARFPDTRSNDILTFDFTEAFSEKKLKIIGAATDRIALGRGEFDKLYQLAKQIARQYSGYISGDDVPDKAMTDEMVDAFTRLETLASDWLASSEAKWDRKGGSGKDKITRIKEIEARGMLKGARATLFQLRNADKLESDATAQLMAELDQARDKARSGKTVDVEAYRAKDAELLGKLCGTERPDTGTSDVKLIMGPDQEVAFAFKSIEGESDMMGTPKGFGTAREVLMSKLTERLGFSWPKVTMATMDGKAGALIEGVQGAKHSSDFKAEDVPAKALQQILLTNLVGGQFDIKWEDVRFNRKDGEDQPTCMDGGAAFSDPQTLANFLLGNSDGKPGLQIFDSIDPAHNGCLPEAEQPMDPALVKTLLAIDVKSPRTEMNQHARQLQADHGMDLRKLGLDTGLETSIVSIEGMQAILRDTGGRISLVDFMKRYYDEVVEDRFAAPLRADWEAKQFADYDKIVRDHGRLLAPRKPTMTAQDVFLNVTQPTRMAALDELVTLAGKGNSVADMLEAYDYKLPLPAIDDQKPDRVKKIRKEIKDGLPEYDKLRDTERYAGLIVDKTGFKTHDDAWAAVMAEGQRDALKRLANLADAVAKKQNAKVTAADLLTRYGYKIPTSNFKPIADDIAQKLKSDAIL